MARIQPVTYLPTCFFLISFCCISLKDILILNIRCIICLLFCCCCFRFAYMHRHTCAHTHFFFWLLVLGSHSLASLSKNLWLDAGHCEGNISYYLDFFVHLGSTHIPSPLKPRDPLHSVKVDSVWQFHWDCFIICLNNFFFFFLSFCHF